MAGWLSTKTIQPSRRLERSVFGPKPTAFRRSWISRLSRLGNRDQDGSHRKANGMNNAWRGSLSVVTVALAALLTGCGAQTNHSMPHALSTASVIDLDARLSQ